MIKRILSLFVSGRTTLVLLFLLALSIAVATFMEDRYDTVTAQQVIYRAWWFEAIIALLAVNFIGNLKKYRYLRGNPGALLFHIGFILLIVGAGVTRFFGFEGTMHIREGENTNAFLSAEPYLQVEAVGPKGVNKAQRQLYMSSLGSNAFTLLLALNDGKELAVSYERYLPKAALFVREDAPGGQPLVSLKVSAEGSSMDVYLKKGERINAGGTLIAFGDTALQADVLLTEVNGRIEARSRFPMIGMSMAGGRPDTTQRGNVMEMREKNLFQCNDVMFAFKKFYPRGDVDFRSDESSQDNGPVLTVSVTYDGKQQRVHLSGPPDNEQPAQQVHMGDLTLSLKYCPLKQDLPFYVKLNDFILTRYSGSNSPSSFASEVTVNDPEMAEPFNKRIYMNHVLDHRGYRFFQSSYDPDESGTVLSVNHDLWGTWISYLSYLVLLIGFIITMFTRNSRFQFLIHSIGKLREKRKPLVTVLFILSAVGSLRAQHNESHVLPKPRAEQFGRILVQTIDGRIEPLHTLAFDALHKISKKDRFKLEGRPEMDAMQIVIDMLADPAFWEQQKVIYVSEPSVGKLINLQGKYASFKDFLNDRMEYKLSSQVEKAFQKPPGKQTGFDKELIKVDERVNLYYQLLRGSMLKIFPEDAGSHKWVDWMDTAALRPLHGPIEMLNADLQLINFNYNGILALYLQELMAGFHSGNYSRSDKILGYIRDIQKNNVLAAEFPSDSKITLEINYNKSGIFWNLVAIYLTIALVLLVFTGIENFSDKRIRWVVWVQWAGIAALAGAFLYHTYGMILRWYLSGHAPWSNGYEALLLVAWSSVFAGFFFMKNTKIVQAATAFLAGIILLTAGLSNYDPQLSNLQPVLQSYWLVVHVAVITMSYGFLMLGCILGFLNMFFYLFKSRQNRVKMELLISEMSFINEANLQIGLFLATLGTFLGGVWASESWGRYWGWDAKESWAFIIVLVYALILHIRLVPAWRGMFVFNVCSILGFSSVLMTFVGVNYYLSKGLHSYAADDKAVFPLWGWISIGVILLLITAAGLRHRKVRDSKGA